MKLISLINNNIFNNSAKEENAMFKSFNARNTISKLNSVLVLVSLILLNEVLCVTQKRYSLNNMAIIRL